MLARGRLIDLIGKHRRERVSKPRVATTKRSRDLDAGAGDELAGEHAPLYRGRRDGDKGGHKKESMTKETAKASLNAAKNVNDSLGNDQQLQSIKLQSMMSQYSNAVNMMSNILKAGYDAGKNTLGNIHY